MRPWLALLLLVSLIGPVVAADDWPMFRADPRQTGVATGKLPAKLEVVWKFEEAKDAFEAAAAIVGDTVYVGCMNEHLYALELANGKLKWKYKGTDGFKATPAVVDGRVIIGDLRGTIHCIDAAKGTKIWAVETEAEILSSANISDGKALVGSGDGTLFAIDIKTGNVAWKYKTDGAIQSSVPIADGKTFVAGCDPMVHVVEVATGKRFAVLDVNVQGPGSAAVVGDMLYLGTANRNIVVGIDWKKGKTLWEYPSDRDAAFHSSPAIVGDLVVIGGHDRLVHGIDRKTGEGKWTFATRGRIESSPVIVGDRVFIGSKDGSLYELDLAKGTKLREYPLGSPVPASPAVAGNRLIIGTEDGIVYCFGAK